MEDDVFFFVGIGGQHGLRQVHPPGQFSDQLADIQLDGHILDLVRDPSRIFSRLNFAGDFFGPAVVEALQLALDRRGNGIHHRLADADGCAREIADTV